MTPTPLRRIDKVDRDGEVGEYCLVSNDLGTSLFICVPYPRTNIWLQCPITFADSAGRTFDYVDHDGAVTLTPELDFPGYFHGSITNGQLIETEVIEEVIEE